MRDASASTIERSLLEASGSPSFSTTKSKAPIQRISTEAADIRLARSSPLSVPRPSSLPARTPAEGGRTKTSTAPGIAALTFRAPTTSMSRITERPAASVFSTQPLDVPYLYPWTRAHSRKNPSRTSSSNSSSVTKS